MTVRIPKPESAARILQRELRRVGCEIRYSQALELLARAEGFRNYHTKRAFESRQLQSQEDPTGRLLSAARQVLACWETGDLAGAVRDLDRAVQAMGAKGAPSADTLIVRLGDAPLSAELLKELEARNDIRAIVEIESSDLLEHGLDSFLGALSERMTGSICGLLNINYRAVSIPNPSDDAVAFEVTAEEIEWETIDQSDTVPVIRLGDGPLSMETLRKLGAGNQIRVRLEIERKALGLPESETDLHVFLMLNQPKVDPIEVAISARITGVPHGLQNIRLSEVHLPDLAKGAIGLEIVADLVDVKELQGLSFFVATFRRTRSPEHAVQLREVAREFLRENLIKRSEYEALMEETGPVIRAWQQTPAGRPDTSKPFHACKLPRTVDFVEFVSSDARACEWSDKRQVTFYDEQILNWLEEGMVTADFDLTDDVIEYRDADSSSGNPVLTVQDLVEAQLAPDGRFELKDGRELYLIEEGMRWYPNIRAY